MQPEKILYKKAFGLVETKVESQKFSARSIVPESFRSLPTPNATFMASDLDYIHTKHVRILKVFYSRDHVIFEDVRKCRKNKVKPLVI